MENKKSIKKLLIKIFVSTDLIFYILYKVDKNILITNLQLLNIKYAPLIVLFILLNYVISSYRWKQLLVHNNAEKASFSYLTSLYFIGSFFNNFMPTSIGGDVYKIFKLSKKIGDSSGAFASTFMERFTGVLVLAVFTLISFADKLGILVVGLVLGFCLCVYIGFYLLQILSKKINFIKKIYDSFVVYKDHKKILFIALILSILVQLMSVLTQYTIFTAMGIHFNFLYALFAFPIITLATFFIPSLNGLGVQDALYIQFFGQIGVSAELALASSVLYHLFRLGVSLIGGVFYAMGKAD